MSKTKFFFDSLEDSERRLGQTVVVCQGEPVWIQKVLGLSKDQQAEVIKLPWKGKNDKELVPLTPAYFRVRDLPTLGYVDFGDFSHYCSRMPLRQNKQGYCRANVSVQQDPMSGKAPHFESLLESKNVVDMFKGKYRAFDEVFHEISSSNDPLKRAFSKVLALQVDDMESITVEHRGIKVAVANNHKKTGPQFRLVNKYFYLKEELQENGIRLEA